MLAAPSAVALRGPSTPSLVRPIISWFVLKKRWLSSSAVIENGGDCTNKEVTSGEINVLDLLEANLKPCDVVRELDKHIVGQSDAKRAVAIALRNRWRRKNLPVELRKEVTPRNVLMIGPTGCGKTEVARRMAQLGGAPFIKVEATKFTEVGYHGRDVDQIIRDLVDISMNLTKKKQTEKLKGEAEGLVEERLLDILTQSEMRGHTRDRESFREMLREGLFDDQEIELDVPASQEKENSNIFRSDFSPVDPETEKKFSQVFTIMATGISARKGIPTQRKRMSVAEAREVILNIEIDQMMESFDLKKEAVTAVEESGIVFIDEIDKICSSRDAPKRGADASDEGVQRDLLPLVEGTTISTKYGNVNTDYILFIASGAFHSVKPSDMLPELQGRLPIRVELKPLTEDDLYRILTEPIANVSTSSLYNAILSSIRGSSFPDLFSPIF